MIDETCYPHRCHRHHLVFHRILDANAGDDGTMGASRRKTSQESSFWKGSRDTSTNVCFFLSTIFYFGHHPHDKHEFKRWPIIGIQHTDITKMYTTMLYHHPQHRKNVVDRGQTKRVATASHSHVLSFDHAQDGKQQVVFQKAHTGCHISRRSTKKNNLQRTHRWMDRACVKGFRHPSTT